MQLQYVYCIYNLNVQSEKAMYSVKVIQKSIEFRAGMDLKDYWVQLLHIADEETGLERLSDLQ